MSGVFITGTDTDCGKTTITRSLMIALKNRGLSVMGMKPIASGSERRPEGLRNQDALYLMEASSEQAPYEVVNPYAFEPPIAPHIAAAGAGIEITLDPILESYANLSPRVDWTVVEGVGGWQIPLSERLMLSSIPQSLKLPVVLVIGVRLGCINHALLTMHSISTSGCKLVGWVGNQLETNMLMQDANLATLKALIAAPCLGIVPWEEPADPERIATHLNIEPILATARAPS